jgi:universal stress protein E
MDKLNSILVVANRTSADRALLHKAIVIARSSLGAKIHLFYCDAELAYSLRHSYDTDAVEKAWTESVSERLDYLETLRAGARAPDVDISVAAACDSPLYQGVVRKIREHRPDLVMKSVSGAHPLRRLTLDDNDWQLMRACPATFMLVRGKEWRIPPRFAAFVDVSDQETPHLAEEIIHTSEYFNLGCGGELDVVYSERGGSVAERAERAEKLRRLTREYRIGAEYVHVLKGDPDVTLPEFATGQCYDALVLGALTHRNAIAALVGTLTGKLVDCVDCDFILVKAATPVQVNTEAASLTVVNMETVPLQPDGHRVRREERVAQNHEVSPLAHHT